MQIVYKNLLLIIYLIFSVCKGVYSANPGQIFLKTDQQAITQKYIFKLFTGRIMFKKRAQSNAEWKFFGEKGLPGTSGVKGLIFDKINRVSEISTDGDNLIALSAKGRVYYTKISKIKWNDSWGKPLSGQLFIPQGARAWSISHRWGKQLGYYEDIAGKKHYMGAGVTTLYILDKNGDDIYYADPWLPPKFSHNVAMPLQGRFIASNMSVSGSTIFIINQIGEMYTRLYDFDTSGQNSFLKYTYDPGNVRDLRILPAENWFKQQAIKGKITESITILQTGKGNAARELRVEGINQGGQKGYYYKKIFAEKWNFMETGQNLTGKIINNSPDIDRSKYTLLGSIKIKNYRGIMSSLGVKYKVNVELYSYSPYCPPARLCIIKDGNKYEIPLHFRHILKFKNSVRYLGMLILNDKNKMTAFMKSINKDFFKGHKFIELKIIEKKSNIFLVSNMKRTFFQFTIKVKK